MIFSISGLANWLPVDKLFWNGQAITVLNNSKASLLELRHDIDSLRSKFFREKESDAGIFCFPTYIAEWTIIEDEIFLTNIFCPHNDTNLYKSDLKQVFDAEYEDGKVKGAWINEQVIIPKGELIHFIDRIHQFYEAELVLTFKNGKLIDQKEYDNSKSHKSLFTENQNILNNFIYSNINWEKVPDLKNEKVRVSMMIYSGETIKPDSVYVFRGSDNDILNQEALRVVNLIPEWDVYYRREKFYRIPFSVPVVFDEQKRMKYAH